MFGLEAIFRNGVPVGHLRRADYGFFIDKTLGYGYIRNPDGGVVRHLRRYKHQPTVFPLYFYLRFVPSWCLDSLLFPWSHITFIFLRTKADLEEEIILKLKIFNVYA
ncbi:hypothetical protein AMECASPLE_003946 [Ameca splendens]|uniref:Aminomethyltransferase C-terminal domain-containing protein n=1 Tax=Ameca splendens TaxID=208324 RepID=A0ABV0YKS2_9TELE